MTTYSLSQISSTQTMTSREIAELTGKQHAHVMRDIRAMIDSLRKSELACNVQVGAYMDEQDKPREMYLLDKQAALTLVSSYNTSARFAIFCRLEIENIREILSDFDATDLPKDLFVYVAMECKSKRYKVGISADPVKRVDDMSRNHPEGLILMAAYKATDAGYLSETKAHQLLGQWRLNGEWFSSDAPIAKLSEVLQ